MVKVSQLGIMIMVVFFGVLYPSCVRAEQAPSPSYFQNLSDTEQKKWLHEVESATERSNSLQIQTTLPKSKTKLITPSDVPSMNPQPVAKFILWAAILAIFAVIITNLKDNLWSSSRGKRIEQEKEQAILVKDTAARMDKAQVEADDLARYGDFREAMHVLLLQSVHELRRRLDVSIAASLTSREILHQVGLSSEGQHVFANIVSQVEISYFGDHQPEESEYLLCRSNFEKLSQILQQRAV